MTTTTTAEGSTMTTTKATDELLTKIAVHFFPTCETLETRNSDSLDFHETAVWSIKEALQQAFEIGRQTADETPTTEASTIDDRDREFAGGIADAIMDAIYETCRGNDVPVDAMTAIGREALRQASERNG